MSPTYAREILTPEFGFGFEGILATRSADLVGILNGIDTDVWNPQTDPYLPAHFTADTLEAKATVKKALLELVNLPTRRRQPGAAGDRSGLTADGSERVRSDRRRRRAD